MVDWSEPKNIERLRKALLPYAHKRAEALLKNGTRFAHYTSADSAIKILRNNNVWLRNSIVMNDFSEIQHGQDCLRFAWQTEGPGNKLKTLLEKWGDGIVERIENTFNSRMSDRNNETFLLSISEHGSDDIDEDKYGRLSMWRAYGGNTNVALVFNNTPFLSASDALKAYTSPVLYKDKEGFVHNFGEFVASLENNFDFISAMTPDMIVNCIAYALHYSVLSTKHPGFAEEKEWRIIYSPTIQTSEHITGSIEIIQGVPQQIYKIPLINHPAENFTGATLRELLDKIIIGPTQYPWPIFDAFMKELDSIGVDEPAKKINISAVPLRR